MRHIPLIAIMFLLCIVAPLAAQDATPDTGWPIEQRCVGDPTPPPADWSYDGTILYQGKYGIHGLRSDWPTSRVLAFTNITDSDQFLYGGALSPDFYWYAAAAQTQMLNPVPYIADFAELKFTTPRPFYCSPRIFSTIPARPGKVAYFDPHHWYFFTMPNMLASDFLTLPVDRIYVSPDWNW